MKFWLRITLSIALVVVLFTYVVDGREVVSILHRFETKYLLLAIIVVTLDRVLMTFKWTLLLRAQGYRLPLLQGVMIYCTSMVWGLALPTTVGADAIRAVMVTKRGFNGTDVVTSIVIERMVGFVLALALGLVSLGILRTLGVLDARFDSALYLGVAMLVGVTALLVAALNETLVGRIVAQLPRAVRDSKVMHYLDRFAAAYRSLGRSTQHDCAVRRAHGAGAAVLGHLSVDAGERSRRRGGSFVAARRFADQHAALALADLVRRVGCVRGGVHRPAGARRA